MRREQKTIDSFDWGDRAEPEPNHAEAPSIPSTQCGEGVTYDNLIDAVVDVGNIKDALRKVVGNHGAPGVDGMTVRELVEWLSTNTEALIQEIRDGKYIPTPVRRKEIPKPNGGVRNLGIPTVKDRLVQQMVVQVLEPIYDPTFSESSFGFRPGRNAQDAILQAKEFYDSGLTTVVDLDLEKFFDNLNQDFLMNILRVIIKDKTLITLIKRFLRAGVTLPDGLTQATTRGSPQGGPLSPLLSNIYLDRFDRELESRGHRFCRYADDCVIYVKTPRAGERVRESVTRYLEKELKLKVNREKTHVGSPADLQFLGFIITRRRNGSGISPHPSKVKAFKNRVREITKRNRGRKFETILEELNSYLRGWLNYYGLLSSGTFIDRTDKWIRRRLRQYIIKQWKRKGTIVRNLGCRCPPSFQCPDGSASLGWMRIVWGAVKHDGWWQRSNSPAVQQGLSNSWFREQGLYTLSENWDRVKERCFNRRVPNGMHGGVRGRMAN